MSKHDSHKTIITPGTKLLDLNLREVLQYRDLIFLFVKRDFISMYKQTILGPLWALIQPLLTTVLFSVIFGRFAKLTTLDCDGNYMVPSFLFYLAGNICWSYFSKVLDSTSKTFITNRAVMSKVYYPRIISPIATAFSNLISFGIQFMLFTAIWLFFIVRGGTDVQISFKLLLVPFVVLQMMILAVGLGLIVSCVTTKYRDLTMLVAFGLQLWQYASPIAYGLNLIPEQYRNLYLLNPIATIVITFRYAFFGFGYFDIMHFTVGFLISAFLLFAGFLLFNRVEKNFSDSI